MTCFRLQDTITCRRRALAHFEKQHGDKLRHLDVEIKRLREQVASQENKSKHFETVYLKKFFKLWGFNEWQVRCLATKILLVDKQISEQLLGIPWEPPKCSDAPLDIFPVKLSSTEEKCEVKMEEPDVTSGQLTIQSIPAHKMRDILFSLAEGAHFLIDGEVLTLLKRLDSTQQTMIRLDLLFSVLGIRTEEEVKTLVRCFHKRQAKLTRSISLSESSNIPPHSKLTKSYSALRFSSGQADNANIVVKALTDFLGERQNKMKDSERTKSADLKPVENVWNRVQIEAYWSRYLRVMSTEKELVWSSLIRALQKHRVTVVERSGIEKDNFKLRRQNEELNDLIQKCLHIKISSKK